MYSVFVYGTLKRNHDNNDILEDSIYLGDGILEHHAIKYSGGIYGFPVAFKRKNNIVKGELYAVDDKTLRLLDLLENEGDMYLRKKKRIKTETEYVPAYVYIGNKDFWNFNEMKDVGKYIHEW